MDIYCPVCGEPWEVDTLHDELSRRLNGRSVTDEYYTRQFRLLQRDFAVKGCVELGSQHAPTIAEQDKARAELSAEMFALLGDDIDGVASAMDDFEGLL